MKISKQTNIIIVAVIVLFSLLTTANASVKTSVKAAPASAAKDTKFKPYKKISQKELNKYFSDSAFIGNSISKGLKMYFDSKGKKFLGHPTMLVQGCYSFANDKRQGSEYQIRYKGKKLKAKDAVAAAKVKYVFINMGTNDLWKPASQTYKDYVQYIKGIRKRNPKLVIFIQGTTPMCSSRNRRFLNNSAIRNLNKKMKKYCDEHKDLYYVDISEKLKTASGGLKAQYSSDNYVHLTMSGYKIWTKNLTSYVRKLILLEKNAIKAVEIAQKSKTQINYDTAEKWVLKLEKSTVKQKLLKKLKHIKPYISEPQPDESEEIEEDPTETPSDIPENSVYELSRVKLFHFRLSPGCVCQLA